jgi:hypothetical protein
MFGVGGRLRPLVWQLSNGPVGTAVLLHDWRGLAGTAGLAAPLDRIWAVRRDWPDGTHELLTPRIGRATAQRALAADARFWRRGPVRPRLTVVSLALAEFRSHPGGDRWCRSSTCPTEESVSSLVVSG